MGSPNDSYKSTVRTYEWPSDGNKFYVKIKVTGRRSVFKAKSYTANKKYLYGYIIDITRPFLDNRTALATFHEYIGSDVMKNGSLINNTYIVIKPIGCQFLKSGHDLDLYQGQYPYPLPPSTRSGSFHMRHLTDILFTSCPGFAQSEYFA